ncbi:MAG TPA: glycosyltransferase family 4 protein [Pyrinomonadaceae bacterium]
MLTNHQPLQVAIVIPQYPPTLGGAEMHAAQLSAVLARRGHQVMVLTTSLVGRTRSLPSSLTGPTLCELASENHQRWFALRCGLKLLRERRKYSIVQFVHAGLHTLVGMMVVAALRKHVIVMFAGTGYGQCLEQTRLGRFELQLFRKIADRVFILNSEMFEELMALGFSRAQLAYLTCGVDHVALRPASPAERKRLRRKWGVPSDAVVITTICRFVPEKRLDTIVDAFAQVHRAASTAILMMGGDGPEYDSITDQVRRLGLTDATRFLGPLGKEQVAEVLRLTDVYMLVSSSEGIPLALMEAMAAGLPSIVSDIPGTEALVQTNREGYRIKAGDSQAIANTLLKLLQDVSLRQRLGADARQRILQGYTLDIIAAQHEQVYGDVLKSA